jgi:class 3 adenylate cyclase
VHYTRSGEASLAYTVFGDGSVDLLLLFGWVSHLEDAWESAPLRRFLERLGEFSRVILYDSRAVGISDDLDATYTIEQDAQDALAVLEAVGSERVALYGKWHGGAVAAKLAAEHPQRVAALILYASVARGSWAPDYDWALTAEQREALVETMIAEWGEMHNREAARWAPSMADDPALANWFARHQRLIATPGKARIRMQELARVDVRELLPRIEAPTLVMHRREDQVWDIRHSRYLAEHIPGARYVELEGRDTVDFVGDTEAIVGEVEEFLTGVRGVGERSRALLTVMFTDIVESTSRAAELGDERWRDLLAHHAGAVRKEIERFGGREVKTVGDGFLVTFDGPPSAGLRCARAIQEAARGLGTEVRIGLHTGECELIGDDVGGMAVHVAARVSGLARPGEVLVSSGVSAAVVGGPFRFVERGANELKGVPGRWELFALEV